MSLTYTLWLTSPTGQTIIDICEIKNCYYAYFLGYCRRMVHDGNATFFTVGPSHLKFRTHKRHR